MSTVRKPLSDVKQCKVIRVNGKIIHADFNYIETLRIKRIIRSNNAMIRLLLCLVALTFVLYYGVTTTEGKIYNMNKDVYQLYYENLDMLNKVESAKSFYNVNDKATKSQGLIQAGKTMHINEITKEMKEIEDLSKSLNVAPVRGF